MDRADAEETALDTYKESYYTRKAQENSTKLQEIDHQLKKLDYMKKRLADLHRKPPQNQDDAKSRLSVMYQMSEKLDKFEESAISWKKELR
eukprot:CAMPEP_0197537026 /NCGR_PEP_ID=MMETSP1318-20131121/55606_1 /TAXON_ID=552666 /ORGANISM="Partenskyella glossopodia, Strain RCC365" /LENGTH=90 /DNA_ID=CAMNT_0043095077 /DNA_START=150 /DNA_END=422 /DNA_ORIENTATION=+